MKWTGRHLSLAITLVCGITVIAIGGLAGVGLLVAMSISGFIGHSLANWIARRYSHFSYPLQIVAPSTMITVAAIIFIVAFVKGADAVKTWPGWVWNIVVCYGGAVYALTARLFYHRARKIAPRV